MEKDKSTPGNIQAANYMSLHEWAARYLPKQLEKDCGDGLPSDPYTKGCEKGKKDMLESRIELDI
ncbi:MAG: hypothetical protein G8345_02025 [Magnetococcales bacterium]|nr:hypothetical protein [Magnetococcales bacterium]NGZ25647.1 hypothetical protein [Magnetococcales bacterium]